jgi:pimeloyl-ACP methyl ester carboxylesterase
MGRALPRERPGTGDGWPLLLLHGYPSSSFDWRRAFNALPARHLIVFDFLGYGLSDKPRDQLYSLSMQADIADAMSSCRPESARRAVLCSLFAGYLALGA